MKRQIIVKLFLLLCVFLTGTGSAWADGDPTTTVWVKRAFKNIKDSDIVILVDTVLSKAMANNPRSGSSPGAVSVTLNEDLNRFTADTDLTNAQWKVTITGTDGNRTIKFTKYPKEKEENADSLLCAVENVDLRVDTETNNIEANNTETNNTEANNTETSKSTNVFDFYYTENGYLRITLKDNETTNKDWFVACTSQVISSSWELKENESEATKIAFFVLSEKPDISLTFPYRNYEADYNNGSGTFNAPTATANPVEDITYFSSNEDVAEVNASTGSVTLKKRGTAKITAFF